MASKNVRCAKNIDSLEIRLCRFEETARELELRITSFGKKKRSRSSVRAR